MSKLPGRVRRGLIVAGVGVAGSVYAPCTYATPVDDAAAALGHGDGVAAANIIAQHGYAQSPWVLGDIIYAGGVIAVDGKRGNAFAEAVPVAFLRGGVTYIKANEAFEYAALTVFQKGYDIGTLAPQLMPGGLAILRTEAAYAGFDLPSIPNTTKVSRKVTSTARKARRTTKRGARR